jgi:hypothetical protein
VNSVDTTVSPVSIQQLAQAEALLRRGGVGPKHWKLLVDDVAVRNRVIRAMLVNQEDPPLVDISGEFDQGAMDRFVRHVFESHIHWLELGYRYVDGQEPGDLATTETIKDLLEGLDSFHVAVAVLRSGFLDGKEIKASEVAKRLGVTTDRVSHARAEVTKHVRARQKSEYPLATFTRGDKPVDRSIEDLNLSVRSYNALIREGVRSIEDLTEKSADELLNIRNFGRGSLDEVQNILAEHGLGLRLP